MKCQACKAKELICEECGLPIIGTQWTTPQYGTGDNPYQYVGSGVPHSHPMNLESTTKEGS